MTNQNDRNTITVLDGDSKLIQQVVKNKGNNAHAYKDVVFYYYDS